MPVDRSFVEGNRAATQRIRDLAARLSDEQLQTPVGEHWTVAIALAHMVLWERRVIHVLDVTEQEGKLAPLEIDIAVNDLSLPLWAAIPPRAAANLAIEVAQAVDRRLEQYPPALLELVHGYNERWVLRYRHRNGHLDEVDAALNG